MEWKTARERADAAGLLAGELMQPLVRVPLAVDAAGLARAVLRLEDGQDPGEDVWRVGSIPLALEADAEERFKEVPAAVASALGSLRAPVASASFVRVPFGETLTWDAADVVQGGERLRLRLAMAVSGRAQVSVRDGGGGGTKTEVVVPGDVWAVSRDAGCQWIPGGGEDTVLLVVDTMGAVPLFELIARGMGGPAGVDGPVPVQQDPWRFPGPSASGPAILLESWAWAGPWRAMAPDEVDGYVGALLARLYTGKNVTPIMRQKLMEFGPAWRALLGEVGLGEGGRVTAEQASAIAAWISHSTEDLAESWCRSDAIMLGQGGVYRVLPRGPSLLDAVEPLLRDLMHECSGDEEAAAGLIPSSEGRPPCGGGDTLRAHVRARPKALAEFEASRPQAIVADSLEDPRWVSKPKVPDALDRVFTAKRTDPIVFVGGVPRSGTTLMRVLLDAHPDVRCGEETRAVPEFANRVADELEKLNGHSRWKERSRLDAAGVTYDVQLEAAAMYLLRIIEGHGEPAKYLCNKDPMTMARGSFLVELFPRARFIFMVRDGRSVAHSLVEREVSIGGMPKFLEARQRGTLDATENKYVSMIEFWASTARRMDSQCSQIYADGNCMPVVYERLATDIEEYLPKVLEFAGVPWDDAVLHHEDQFVDGSIASGTISLSGLEPSSQQVVKPVNADATRKWVNDFSREVVLLCNNPAAASGKMLRHFGYIDADGEDVLVPQYPRENYGEAEGHPSRT